jgi:hypothetical protein
LEKEERWKLKLKILIPLFLISLVFFVPNSKAASFQTESGIFGDYSSGSLIGRETGVSGCVNNSTLVTYYCMNERSNHDSDSSYITTDFTFLLANFNTSYYTMDGFYEYINSSGVVIDLISFSFVARVTTGGNDTLGVLLTPFIFNQPTFDCLDIESININLFTTVYQTYSTPFSNDCNLSDGSPGPVFTQENLRYLILYVSITCNFVVCINYTHEIRITSIYMTVIWHDSSVVIPSTLTNSQIALAIILLVVWIAFFILGCYLPSGIFCMISGFCAIVLSIIYILPFNDISFVVVLGLAICCFLIGIMLVVKGDC